MKTKILFLFCFGLLCFAWWVLYSGRGALNVASSVAKVEVSSLLNGEKRRVVIDQKEAVAEFNAVIRSPPVSHVGGYTCFGTITYTTGQVRMFQIGISPDCGVLTIVEDSGNPFKDPTFQSFSLKDAPLIQKALGSVLP